MKQVWKCDFCLQTGTQEEIEVHEKDCSFNPANKTCWTCRFRYEEGAPISGFWNECELGKKCYSFDDEETPCDSWEQEIDED